MVTGDPTGAFNVGVVEDRFKLSGDFAAFPTEEFVGAFPCAQAIAGDKTG
jgi:hypothetical protein